VSQQRWRCAGQSLFAGGLKSPHLDGSKTDAPERNVLYASTGERRADWYQNIKAAGTCRIRLGGGQLTLGEPVLVPAGQATRDMPWLFGFALRHVVRSAECVQLPVMHPAAAPADHHRAQSQVR